MTIDWWPSFALGWVFGTVFVLVGVPAVWDAWDAFRNRRERHLNPAERQRRHLR